MGDSKQSNERMQDMRDIRSHAFVLKILEVSQRKGKERNNQENEETGRAERG